MTMSAVQEGAGAAVAAEEWGGMQDLRSKSIAELSDVADALGIPLEDVVAMLRRR